MKKNKRPFPRPRVVGTGTACALAALLVAFHAISSAQQADGADRAAAPPLVVFAAYNASQGRSALSSDGAATLEDIRSDPAAFGIRIGHSAPESVLAARSLSLELPSETGASGKSANTNVVFTRVDVDYNDEGFASLYARDEEADSEVALVIQGSDVLGSIRKGDDVYKVHPLGDGLTAVYGYDTSLLRRHPDGWGEFTQKSQEEFLRKWDEMMHRDTPEPSPRNGTYSPGAAADTGDEIDILVAYTPRARRAAGNIDAFIQFAIDNTHRIYRNSQIGLRLRLVHKYETDYVQDSDMLTDLERLADIDGHMDEVHDLRNRHGADLVVLIVARNTESACGVAFLPPYGSQINTSFASQGFSVIGHNCETSTYHSFAHEIGHNQGADHDPDNGLGAAFSYGHGRCNTDRGWHTVMAYASNQRGRCAREIEYFSSPSITYDGTPTGDAKVRDNRRVLFNTAERVANFRRSTTPQTHSHTLSLVTPVSDSGLETFVRVINRSNGAGTVSIHAIDDEGGRFGPATLSLEARQTRHFASVDLEEGNASKGLHGGVGDGAGNWRLELATELNIEPLAYIRTEDGFVTTVHEVAAETRAGSKRYHVPFFNPGKNESQVSRLRLINPGSDAAEITITGVDDRGDPSSGGEVSLTLGPGAARMVSAEQLEQGGAGLTGRFDAGSGKWRLSVSADRPIQVLSLLNSRNTGNLANLSRGQAGSSIPLVTPASDLALQTFVRVINRSDDDGTVRIHAIDDEGRRFDPTVLSLEAGQTRHNSAAHWRACDPARPTVTWAAPTKPEMPARSTHGVPEEGRNAVDRAMTSGYHSAHGQSPNSVRSQSIRRSEACVRGYRSIEPGRCDGPAVPTDYVSRRQRRAGTADGHGRGRHRSSLPFRIPSPALLQPGPAVRPVGKDQRSARPIARPGARVACLAARPGPRIAGPAPRHIPVKRSALPVRQSMHARHGGRSSSLPCPCRRRSRRRVQRHRRSALVRSPAPAARRQHTRRDAR